MERHGEPARGGSCRAAPERQGRPACVVLGRVVGAHGLRGQLRVRVLGDDPLNLCRVTEVALGASADDPEPARYEVTRCVPGRPGEVRLCLAGVRRREQAEALRGRLVLAAAAALAPLPAGEHYWYELLDCEVFAEDGTRVGRVAELWDTGPHDVLVIETGPGEQVLVPAARELLREVDVERRRLVIRVIPGLLEARRSGG